MLSDVAVPLLAPGAFFGDCCRGIATASFQFSELEATLPEREVPRHTHEAPHFILITSGLYVTQAHNHRGVCAAGSLIFNPTRTTHRDRFRSVRGRFLSISPSAEASRWLDRASPVPLLVAGEKSRVLDDPLIADRMMREMMRELRRSGFPSALVLEGLGLELIGLLCAAQESQASRFTPGWLRTAREMVEESFQTGVTIASLAAMVGVHPVYLARAYRRHFGCSPGQHLRQCRLIRVQGLLSRTNLPLAEVALQSGFADQSQMTKRFHEHFGLPPGRYRRLHRS